MSNACPFLYIFMALYLKTINSRTVAAKMISKKSQALTKSSGGAFFACVRRSSPFFEKRVVSRVQVKEFTLGGQNLE